MFQSRKQSHATVRLPKLPGQPRFDDVHFLQIEAQRNRGRTVEMLWSSDDRTIAYMLTALVEQKNSKAAWMLYKGQSEANNLCWSDVSNDVGLIHNRVLLEQGGSQSITSGISEIFGMVASATHQKSDSSVITQDTLQATSGAFEAISAGKTKSILEGDLTNMQPPNLLQSITMSNLTGRLNVQAPTNTCEMYFEEGAPVHARTRESSGDSAIIEFMTWEDGKFHFFPEEYTSDRTVKKRLDALIMEGITMFDQYKFLIKHGLQMDSYLLRSKPSLSEAEFEKIVATAAPIDLALQKRFYQTVDNRSTLFEILRKFPLSKSDWVAVVFNFVNTGLLTLSNQSSYGPKSLPLETVNIDQTVIQSFIKSLMRPETGIFTYPAFLYMAEQEFFRFDSWAEPFSVIVFEARTQATPGAVLEPLPLIAVKELAKRINTLKRNLDLLAHYETFDYAMLLPNTTIGGTQVIADRIADVLLSTPLTPQHEGQPLALAIGIASIPEDCKDLGQLLSAASQARGIAKSRHTPVVLYKDLKVPNS